MKQRRLIVSSKHLAELKKLAVDSLPLESCALLAGSVKDSDYVVQELILTKNADRSQTTFSIEPTELLDAYMKAESMGLDIVGIFHSHPAPPMPSNTDLRFMELNPVPWLILSTTSNQVRAFLFDLSVQELEVVTEVSG